LQTARQRQGQTRCLMQVCQYNVATQSAHKYCLNGKEIRIVSIAFAQRSLPMS
jgi:hypothetical protein